VQLNIETLLPWGPEKRVATRNGDRLLRVAAPTEKFSAIWKQHKDTLKAAGLGWSKNRAGEWEVCWWQALSAEVAATENAAIESSRAVDADIDVPTPGGLSLLPFQRAGIQYMQGRSGVLLADQMGLGKTIQAIGLINLDTTIRKVLVVCPASLKINWRNELRKWMVRPLKIAVQTAGEPWVGGQADVVILNYDILGKFPEIRATEWDLLVADEAHFVKNPKALRTQLLLGKPGRKGVDSVPGVRARRRIFATGTPILNKPIELFPLLESLEPGKWTFRDKVRYCAGHQGRWGWDFSGSAHLDELQNRLRKSVMVRRLKSEVIKELPAKRRQIVEVSANGARALVEEEFQTYARHETRIGQLRAAALAAELGDDDEAYRAAAAELKGAQSAAFADIAKLRHMVALAKVPTVIEHVRGILDEGTGKCVVFAHHLDVHAKIAAEFGAECLSITGETPTDERQGIVDKFNTDTAVKVLLLSIKAAGVGLSVRASVEVFAELDWVPANVSQAEDRCHGIGRGIEGEPLLVQHLVLEGSLDARMVQAIVTKQDIADRALDKGAGLVVGGEAVTMVDVGSVAEEQPAKDDAPGLAPDRVAEIHSGLRALAGVCDGAQREDGRGFNKLDSYIGKALAAHAPGLSQKQAALGLRLCRKYRRQLGPELAARLGVEGKEDT
jgi:SWI/SNF-related matrix-associated actin-dependent regulator 1 of chromatin subfamily A